MIHSVRTAFAHRSSGLVAVAPPFSRTFTRRRLLSTLAILEQRDGQLNHGSLSAFTAAKKLGGSVHGIIAGKSVAAAAQEAAKIEGVEKIILVENEAYEKVRDHVMSSYTRTSDAKCFIGTT